MRSDLEQIYVYSCRLRRSASFFLLPTDVLFSIWFFFLLISRVEQVIDDFVQPADAGDADLSAAALCLGYQTVGAYLVLTGYFSVGGPPAPASASGRLLWAWAGGYSRAEDAEEMLPYRVCRLGAIWAAVVASPALWTWGMGMSLWLALFELVIVCIFVTALVMARSTAEAGMLMTETTFRPIDIYRMFGSAIHALGAAESGDPGLL